MNRCIIIWVAVLLLTTDAIAEESGRTPTPVGINNEVFEQVERILLRTMGSMEGQQEVRVPNAPAAQIDMMALRNTLIEAQRTAHSAENLSIIGRYIKENPGLESNPYVVSALESFSRSIDQSWTDIERQQFHQTAHASDHPQENSLPTNESIVVFLSVYLSESEIRTVLEEASHLFREGTTVRVVIRGIKEEHENIYESLYSLIKLSSEYDPVPLFLLDPALFEEHQVTTAPVIMAFDMSNALLAYAEGISSPITVQNRIDEERNLQAHKQVWPVLIDQAEQAKPIRERSVVERIIASYREMNLEGQLRDAMNTYWTGYPFQALAVAEQSALYRVDPTILVEEDIIDPFTGQYIRQAGDVINPLHIRPFNTTLIIFDARDERQLEIAREAQNRAYKQHAGSRIMMLTTHIDAGFDNGWGHFPILNEMFNDQTYLLQSEIVERFALTAAPAIVTADDNYFYIEEVSVHDGL